MESVALPPLGATVDMTLENPYDTLSVMSLSLLVSFPDFWDLGMRRANLVWACLN